MNFKLSKTSNDIFELGWHYLRVHRDYKNAMYWLLQAAIQNHDEAQYVLGELYDGMSTGKHDLEKQAVYWWKRAAANGNVFAQWQLSQCYQQGRGIETSKTKSIYWQNQCSRKRPAQ